MFAYCTQLLHYAEHAALNRIEVARAARRLPVLLKHIADGGLHLTGARLLAPHLRENNVEALIAAARHKSKREIEELIAGVKPQPGVAAIVRKLPTATVAAPAGPVALEVAEQSAPLQLSETASVATPAAARPAVVPLAAERFKVLFTINRDTRDKLRHAQDLMRHVIPDGDTARIFDRALTTLIADLERKRFAATSRPQPVRPSDDDARHIPAAVRRTVWQRDARRTSPARS